MHGSAPELEIQTWDITRTYWNMTRKLNVEIKKKQQHRVRSRGAINSRR